MFIVIGERVNTTLGKVKEAVEKRDAEYSRATQTNLIP